MSLELTLNLALGNSSSFEPSDKVTSAALALPVSIWVPSGSSTRRDSTVVVPSAASSWTEPCGDTNIPDTA